MDKCWCGSPLQFFLNGARFCIIHNENYTKPPETQFKPPKPHIPKWSGKSKTPYGGYEER